MGYDSKRRPVILDPKYDDQHLYAVGNTGTGKSTAVITRRGLGVIQSGLGGLVIDAHGDSVRDIAAHCPERELDRLIYWAPYDREYPVPLNMFECAPGDDRDRVVSNAIGIFQRLWGETWGLGPQLEDILRSLSLAMTYHQLLDDTTVDETHRYNATLKEAHDFLFIQSMRREFYPFIASEMVQRFFKDMYDTMGKLHPPATVTREQIRFTASTTNKIRRFLLNPLMLDIVGNARKANTLRFRDIIRNRQVLLVDLSKGKLGDDNAMLLGSILLSQLAVAAAERESLSVAERRANLFHVMVDEFQLFSTRTFDQLMTEARKFGIALTLAHQHRDQLDREAKGSTLQCGSTICFRNTPRDADEMAGKFDLKPTRRHWRYERAMLPRSTKASEYNQNHPYPLRRALSEIRTFEEQLGRTRNDKVGASGGRLEQLLLDEARLQTLVNKLNREAQDEFPEHFTWVPGERSDDGSAVYTRVAEKHSFLERQREIANGLTQLRNFRAAAQLADGRQLTFDTLPLPDIDEAEARARVDFLIERTRRDYAVRPSDRPSVSNAAYLQALNRQEAQIQGAGLRIDADEKDLT
jgi:hypothetical protein